MVRTILLAAVASALSIAAPAAARNFSIINGTGASLRDIAARPVGTADWVTLAPGLSPGARTTVTVDGDPCAYDLKAKLAADRNAEWSGVNFCETKSVTLNRRDDGVLWVDYD